MGRVLTRQLLLEMNAVEINSSPQQIELADGVVAWRSISIRNEGSTPIASPGVQAANQLDRGDLQAIVAHVCAPGMSDAEKADALFEFMKANVVKWALPCLAAAENPMQILNVYGYCNCGGFSSTLATLATAAGLKARNVHLPGHGVTEIRHDDAWHLYDSNLQVTYPKPGGQLASVEEVQDDLSLLDAVDHDFHAPRTFNLQGVRDIYAQRHVYHPDPPALDELHRMDFELMPGETVTWYRDERARFYPYQNEVFMVEPPRDYIAGGTLRFGGEAMNVDREAESYTQRISRRVPWAIVGGRVRIAGYRTPGDGQVSLLLKRDDQQLTVGGILTEHCGCDGTFSTEFDFTSGAVLPPPAAVLYELELELILYRQQSGTELRLDDVQVEVDLQRAPQTLPPSGLEGVELVYRDQSARRRVAVSIEAASAE